MELSSGEFSSFFPITKSLEQDFRAWLNLSDAVFFYDTTNRVEVMNIIMRRRWTFD